MLETRLINSYASTHPAEVAEMLEAMSAEDAATVLSVLSLPEAAPLFKWLAPVTTARALQLVQADQAGSLLAGIGRDLAQRVLRAMPAKTRAALLEAIPGDAQMAIRRGLGYPPGTAGALMDASPPSVSSGVTVGSALDRLGHRPQSLYYVYLLDESGGLAGVVTVAALVGADPTAPIRSLVGSQEIEAIPAGSEAGSAMRNPGWQRFHALPVLDRDKLVGVLRYETLRSIERELGASSGDARGGASAALADLYGVGLRGSLQGAAILVTGDDGADS